MTHQTAVINVVGLSTSLLGDDTPRLNEFIQSGRLRRLRPVLPAVTCTVQSSMLTGKPVCEHGIVANGWYDRESCEVRFWRQSNRLVHGEKVWEAARRRDPSVSCANCFWWFNMYSSVDVAVTPRPIYCADGRKIPDVHTHPAELRDALQLALGRFPLFKFWGPASSIVSSRWIADASIHVVERCDPDLTFVYLPHLDYGLQKHGPGAPEVREALRDIDAVVGDLLDHFERRGTRVVVLSEYGIESVEDSIHINRVLRERGLLRMRDELGREVLDAGASEAFAVADHQVAHVYVATPGLARELAVELADVRGVENVLDRDAMAACAVDHPRAGDLLLIAERNRWFSYDYWLDDALAPDFARTVDIHRKPGYDPCELLLDPRLGAPRLRVARRLIQKKLGFRALLDVIPLDTSLVRGSHGRIDQPPAEQPVLITTHGAPDGPDELPCTAVHDVILGQLFGSEAASQKL